MRSTTRQPSDSDRVNAARVISGGSDERALLISVANKGLGWVYLGDAVAVGLAYAVEPHAGLLCIDLDLDRRGGLRAERSFEEAVEAARDAGVAHLVTRSGREGHRHLYCVTGQLPDVERAALDDGLRQSGLDVRRTAIRPPLAPHRSGVGHSVPDRAVEVLNAAPDSTATRRFLNHLGVTADTISPSHPRDDRACLSDKPLGDGVLNVLSPRLQQVVRFGHEESRYPSASEGRMAVAAAVVAAGGDANDLGGLLSDPRHQLGFSYRRRPRSWRTAECRRLVQKVALGVTSAEKIDRWEALVAASAWNGRAGHTDLAVLQLFAATARRCRGVDVALAVAEVATEIGTTRHTASRSLRRLQDSEWLTLVEAPSSVNAAVYRLTSPESTETAGSAAVRGPAVDLGCDAARSAALGRAGVRVWGLLSEPRTVADLAAQLGVSPSTVRAHLKRLSDTGCAVRSPTGWVQCGDLTAVAQRAEVEGCRDRARQQLAVARVQRRILLDSRRLAGGPASSASSPSAPSHADLP